MKYYYLAVVILNLGFAIGGYIIQNGLLSGLALFNIVLYILLYKKEKV